MPHPEENISLLMLFYIIGRKKCGSVHTTGISLEIHKQEKCSLEVVELEGLQSLTVFGERSNFPPLKAAWLSAFPLQYTQHSCVNQSKVIRKRALSSYSTTNTYVCIPKQNDNDKNLVNPP